MKTAGPPSGQEAPSPAKTSTPATPSAAGSSSPEQSASAAGSGEPAADSSAAGSDSPAPDSASTDAPDASIAKVIAPDPPVARGPYFVSGPWHGYFWLAQHGAGTTVSATNFDAEQFGAPICIQGTVAATADNTSNAILGVNVNQSSSADMTVQTIAPALDGIRVAITNNGGSPVRLQVQALDGATNEHARWCAELSGAGGFIPWTAFNTACWDGSGAAYQREPISGAMLLIPGATSAQTPFDVCLSALAEASAPAAGSGS